MRNNSIIASLLAFSLSSSVFAQTETTIFIQEPDKSATNIDSIWAKAARKKVKTATYQNNDRDKDVTELIVTASFDNTGKLVLTSSTFEKQFTRSHYNYYKGGYKVLTIKGDEEKIAEGYKVAIIETQFDMKGHCIMYGETTSDFDGDTLMAEGGSGWMIKMKGDLPIEKYFTKTDETEYYTYDSHNYITEIKRAKDFDTELYRRVYDNDQLAESYFMRGMPGLNYNLFEKFEYNKKGLVSKRISGIGKYNTQDKGSTTTYDYNAAGQLIKSVNKYGSYLFTYDAAGRIINTTETSSDKVYITNYSYNAEGLLVLAEEVSGPGYIFRRIYNYTYWE